MVKSYYKFKSFNKEYQIIKIKYNSIGKYCKEKGINPSILSNAKCSRQEYCSFEIAKILSSDFTFSTKHDKIHVLITKQYCNIYKYYTENKTMSWSNFCAKHKIHKWYNELKNNKNIIMPYKLYKRLCEGLGKEVVGSKCINYEEYLAKKHKINI